MLIYKGGENIKKYPFIKQRGIKECGPACTLMILKYYKGYINIDKLSEMMHTNQNGTTAYNIVETLKTLGFNSYGIKTKNLENLKLPCIAHVIVNYSYHHYIVIYKVNLKKQTLLIADPARTLKQMTFKEFKQIWSGVSIQMYPTKPIEHEKEPNTLKFIWYYIKKNIKIIILLNIISLLVNILNILSTLFIPFVLTNFNQKIIASILFSFLIVFFLKNLFLYIKNKLVIKFNLQLDKQLLLDIFWKIINLPYRYYRRKTTGEITSYFSDSNILKSAIIHFSQILMIDLPILIVLLIIININYNLYILLFFYFFIYSIMQKKFKKTLIDDMTRQKYCLNSYIIESISGFETIKNLNINSKIFNTFKNHYSNSNNSIKKCLTQNEKYSFIKNNLDDFILFIIIILLINTSISECLIYYILTSSVLRIIKNIFEFNYSLDELKYSLSSILFLDYKQKSLINTTSKGDIIMQNINFSYDKKVNILSNINLEIKSNDKVLITGPSGSGKSTLLKILKGYYDDYEGTITIGNKDIKYYSFQDIIYVSSKEFFFTGSLIDNINLKSENIKYINICEIDKLFRENKYSLIEENGFNLSDGQKQRIALARALGNFNILILDEALSQVSSDMERKILKKLLKKYSQKTIIYISHRLDNLDLFDQYIKIDKGKVVLNQKRNN